MLLEREAVEEEVLAAMLQDLVAEREVRLLKGALGLAKGHLGREVTPQRGGMLQAEAAVDGLEEVLELRVVLMGEVMVVVDQDILVEYKMDLLLLDKIVVMEKQE